MRPYSRERVFRLANGDKLHAAADLDLAEQLLAKDADDRLLIANLFQHADRLASAISQFDVWIGVDAKRPGMANALNGRCWVRALLGRDLEKALTDCDAALALAPGNANVLDSRGLVNLRMGHFDKAIADYDAALKQIPNNAWSFYGRGIARLRTGQTLLGKADIAAATTLRPQLLAEAALNGIGP